MHSNTIDWVIDWYNELAEIFFTIWWVHRILKPTYLTDYCCGHPLIPNILRRIRYLRTRLVHVDDVSRFFVPHCFTVWRLSVYAVTFWVEEYTRGAYIGVEWQLVSDAVFTTMEIQGSILFLLLGSVLHCMHVQGQIAPECSFTRGT